MAHAARTELQPSDKIPVRLECTQEPAAQQTKPYGQSAASCHGGRPPVPILQLHVDAGDAAGVCCGAHNRGPKLRLQRLVAAHMVEVVVRCCHVDLLRSGREGRSVRAVQQQQCMREASSGVDVERAKAGQPVGHRQQPTDGCATRRQATCCQLASRPDDAPKRSHPWPPGKAQQPAHCLGRGSVSSPSVAAPPPQGPPQLGQPQPSPPHWARAAATNSCR